MPEEDLTMKSGQKSVFDEKAVETPGMDTEKEFNELIDTLISSAERTTQAITGDGKRAGSGRKGSLIGQQEQANVELGKITDVSMSQLDALNDLTTTLMQSMEKLTQTVAVSSGNEIRGPGNFDQDLKDSADALATSADSGTPVSRASVRLDDEFGSTAEENKDSAKGEKSEVAQKSSAEMVLMPIVAPLKAMQTILLSTFGLQSKKVKENETFTDRVAQGIVNTMDSMFKKLTGAFGGVVGAIILAPPLLLGAFLGLMTFLKNTLPAEIVSGFSNIFNGVLDLGKAIFTADFGGIVDALGKMGMGAGEILFGALEAMGLKVGKFADFFENYVEDAALRLGLVDEDEQIAAENIADQKSLYEAQLGKFGFGSGNQQVLNAKGEVIEMTRKMLSGRYGNDAGDAEDFTDEDAIKFAEESMKKAGVTLRGEEKNSFILAIRSAVASEKSKMKLGQISNEEEAQNAKELAEWMSSDLSTKLTKANIDHRNALLDKKSGMDSKVKILADHMAKFQEQKDQALEKFYGGTASKDDTLKEIARLEGRLKSAEIAVNKYQFKKGGDDWKNLTGQRRSIENELRAAREGVAGGNSISQANFAISKDYANSQQKLEALQEAQSRVEAEKRSNKFSAESAEKEKKEAEYNAKMTELQTAIAELTMAVKDNKSAVDKNSEVTGKAGASSAGASAPTGRDKDRISQKSYNSDPIRGRK